MSYLLNLHIFFIKKPPKPQTRSVVISEGAKQIALHRCRKSMKKLMKDSITPSGNQSYILVRRHEGLRVTE